MWIQSRPNQLLNSFVSRAFIPPEHYPAPPLSPVQIFISCHPKKLHLIPLTPYNPPIHPPHFPNTRMAHSSLTLFPPSLLSSMLISSIIFNYIFLLLLIVLCVSSNYPIFFCLIFIFYILSYYTPIICFNCFFVFC